MYKNNISKISRFLILVTTVFGVIMNWGCNKRKVKEVGGEGVLRALFCTIFTW